MGAASSTANPATTSASMNPFWAASQWYFQANNDQILNGSAQLTTSQQSFSINLDSNGWLRKFRCVVRSSGAVGGTPAADGPWNVFQNTSFQAPNGNQFFKTHNGWQYLNYKAFGRPWEGDPTRNYDYAKSINPSFTFDVAPEVRNTFGALQNQDDRRQYKVQGSIGTIANVISGTVSTAPTLTFAAGIETWGAPDAMTLTKQPNQQSPNGATAQTWRQLSSLPLNGAGATNTLDARSITGNLNRLWMLEVRDSNNARQDYLTDPITWTQDNKTLAIFTQADLFAQFQDFYGDDVMSRPVGMYIFPRFLNFGAMVGQGWEPTNGATKVQWQTTTSSTATNVPGTVNILSEQIVPIQGVSADYLNI